MNRKFIVFFLAIAILSILSYLATGAFQGGSIEVGPNGSITETTAGSLTAEGGNVTELNITATVSTNRWQGYYGNVSGDLQLGFGTSVFYDFNNSDALGVYASTDANFDFAALNNATAAEMDTAWGYATGNDQAADIYTYLTNISNVTQAPTVQLNGNGIATNSTILADIPAPIAKGDFVFGTRVNDTLGGTCFNGETCDYQLMVPADGLADTYFFFVEI